MNVRADRRHLLGAVTHVDGTARVQTVRRDANVRFWRLIAEFAELTGVPVTTSDYLELVPKLLLATRLMTVHRNGTADPDQPRHLLRLPQPGPGPAVISEATYQVLARSGGQAPVSQLLNSAEQAQPVVDELLALWAKRLVRLEPRRQAG